MHFEQIIEGNEVHEHPHVVEPPGVGCVCFGPGGRCVILAATPSRISMFANGGFAYFRFSRLDGNVPQALLHADDDDPAE